MKVAEWRCASS